MFRGEFRHSLDGKGRVIVPSRLREGLGDHFVITRGLEKCIFVYPSAEWIRLEQKLRELTLAKEDPRAFNRLIFSGAMDAEADKQGRILIPQYLREHAGIEKDVIIIGTGERVEIWDEAAWKEYFEKVNPKYEQLAEKLGDYNL